MNEAEFLARLIVIEKRLLATVAEIELLKSDLAKKVD